MTGKDRMTGKGGINGRGVITGIWQNWVDFPRSWICMLAWKPMDWPSPKCVRLVLENHRLASSDMNKESGLNPAAANRNDTILDRVCDGCGCLHFVVVISGLCQIHCKQVPVFSRHFPTCGSIRVVLFGFFFLGPLLQHSHWAGHLLMGQIRESLFYITLQIWPESS